MPFFDPGYFNNKVSRKKVSLNRTVINKFNAWQLDAKYYDGKRDDGYGGFKYDGRWATIMPTIIERYGLTNDSTVLDLGCKKGFFMHDLKDFSRFKMNPFFRCYTTTYKNCCWRCKSKRTRAGNN